MVNYHCSADDEVPRRDREQPFLVLLFPGPNTCRCERPGRTGGPVWVVSPEYSKSQPVRTAADKTRLAIPAGFEPATHGVEIRYSIQLRYGTVVHFIEFPIGKICCQAK